MADKKPAPKKRTGTHAAGVTSYVILIDRELDKVWLGRPHDEPKEEDFWFIPSVESSATDHEAMTDIIVHLAGDGIFVQGAEKLGEHYEVAYPDELAQPAELFMTKCFIARIYTEHQYAFVSTDKDTDWHPFTLPEAIKAINESPYDQQLDLLRHRTTRDWLSHAESNFGTD